MGTHTARIVWMLLRICGTQFVSVHTLCNHSTDSSEGEYKEWSKHRELFKVDTDTSIKRNSGAGTPAKTMQH